MWKQKPQGRTGSAREYGNVRAENGRWRTNDAYDARQLLRDSTYATGHCVREWSINLDGALMPEQVEAIVHPEPRLWPKIAACPRQVLVHFMAGAVCRRGTRIPARDLSNSFSNRERHRISVSRVFSETSVWQPSTCRIRRSSSGSRTSSASAKAAGSSRPWAHRDCRRCGRPPEAEHPASRNRP